MSSRRMARRCTVVCRHDILAAFPFQTYGCAMPVRILSLVAGVLLSAAPLIAADADLILHSGKVVTVDAVFSIAEAVAVKDGRVVAVGRTADVLARERGLKTQVIDLKGQTVLPGRTPSPPRRRRACSSTCSPPTTRSLACGSRLRAERRKAW